MMVKSSPKRNYFVPEIIQTSTMDCGPASLKALLEGFGISVNYGRLREACQTDVDGTSIDTIEEIACELGLNAVQIIVPGDHLLLPQTDALPSIVVIRQPNGLTHFVVAWRTTGNFIQIMDPASGRTWLHKNKFLNQLYIHSMPVSEDFAYEWITSDDFISPLRFRLSQMDMNNHLVDDYIETVVNHTSWQMTAALDAAARLTTSLVNSKGIQTGKEAERILNHFFIKASEASHNQMFTKIPSSYWSIHLIDNQPQIKGAVLMSVDDLITSESEDETSDVSTPSVFLKEHARLEDPEPDEKAEFFRLMMKNGPFAISILLITLTLTSLGIFLEAFLLKGLIDFNYLSAQFNSQMQLAKSIYSFFLIRFLLEFSGIAFLLYMGRWFEIHLRIAILQKIPRLGDRYFHSRLTSDMAQRAHEIRQLRELPNLGANYFKTLFEILLTSVGIIWLCPSYAGITIGVTIIVLSISFFTQPILKEQDLSFRTHIGAMNRFYLDALLGLIPVRTHCAEKAVQSEHEVLHVKWWDSGRTFYRTYLIILTIEMIVITAFAIFIIFHYVKYSGEASGVLLLVYWIMKLSVILENFTNILQQYPMQRNRMLRLLEMINSRDETETWYAHQESDSIAHDNPDDSIHNGVDIKINNVNVNVGGHVILKEINLHVSKGEHIAIVGPSGAGKSSLAGLLLGLHRPFSGTVMADNELLHGKRLERLRRELAWVDPSVHIWNRSMKNNLCYGNDIESIPENIMTQADLHDIVTHLPQGIKTPLGESGGLLSGGEGQRVRLGRALLRYNVRLAILDEPFRGLDREKRQEMLKIARKHWQNRTLLYISHDISEAMTFDRVIMIENGQIVENDHPVALMSKLSSRYRSLLEAEQDLNKTLWKNDRWKRWQLKNGALV